MNVQDRPETMEGTDFWMTSKRAGLLPEAAHKLNTKHKSLRLTDSCKEKGTKIGNRKLGKRKFMEKNSRVCYLTGLRLTNTETQLLCDKAGGNVCYSLNIFLGQ